MMAKAPSSDELSKTFLKVGEHILLPFQQESPEAIVAFLAIPGVICDAARREGLAKDVLKLVKLLEPAQQAAVLCVPHAIDALADCGQAEAVIELVAGFRNASTRKTAVLSAPDAILGLANNGQAEAVITLVKGLNFEQQTAVLSALDAVAALANNGQAEAFMEMIRALKPEQQKAILNAPYVTYGLVNNGQADAVISLKKYLAAILPTTFRQNPETYHA